jgi:hypothetical protein
MTSVFSEKLGKWVIVYLDDVLIFSKTKEEHVKHVRWALNKLKENKLIAKKKKYVFRVEEVAYLSCVVGHGKVKTDLKKTKAIQEWPALTDVPQVRQFLRLCNYYRRFVKGFNKIAVPLFDLLQDKAEWKWGREEKKTFETLKDKLCGVCELWIVEDGAHMKVETDSSDRAIGAVLSQLIREEWRPVAFESKKLDIHQQRYGAYERELFALVHAVRTWRHYLLGRMFKAHTNQRSIVNLLQQKDLMGRPARWAETLFLASYTSPLSTKKERET